MSENTSGDSKLIGGRDWRNDLDMDDPNFGDLFNEIGDDYLANCPVARSNVGQGYYMVSRYDDVTRVLKDWETFSNAHGNQSANQDPNRPLFKPNESDPPQHTELRRAINSFFSPKAVAEHEPQVRGIANELIDKALAADAHKMDVVSQYADPLPARTFCQVAANMPLEDMPFLQKTFTLAIVAPSQDDRAAHWMAGHQYMERLLEERKKTGPQGDLVDAILDHEFSDGTPFSDYDRAAGLAHITAAGSITTGAVISGAIYHLASTPKDLEKLRADPSMIPRAMEEFLRYYTSAPCAGRRVVKDTEIAGTQLKASRTDNPLDGDFVAYNLGAANRDPAVFENPGEVDIERSPNPHVAFAAGVHRCIGVHLARLNLRVALEIFLERFPKFELAPGYEPHFQGGITRNLISLPIHY